MRTRLRSKANEQAETPAEKVESSGKSFLRTGDAIYAEAERNKQEMERKKSSTYSPFRFYLKGGEKCEIILLDRKLSDGVAFYEHTINVDGRWTQVPCAKDFAKCPVCTVKQDNSYYVLMLSVLVLREFKTKKGETVTHSKMLLPVKQAQFPLFRKLEAAAIKEGGTMRGMYLEMVRDASNDKSARIGDPNIIEGGRMFDLLSEEDLVEEFGHPAVMSQDGKTVIREANYDITPYDYQKLFPRPDLEQLHALCNSKYAPEAGSVEEAMKEFGEDESPKVSSRVRSRRAATAKEEDSNPFED